MARHWSGWDGCKGGERCVMSRVLISSARFSARRSLRAARTFTTPGKKESPRNWRRHGWEKFPRTRIAGTFTPPSRDLTAAEEMKLIHLLNQSRPDIIWVGIGAPR